MSIHVTLALQGLVDPALRDRGALLRHVVRRYAGLLDGFEIGFFTAQAGEFAEALADPALREALAAFAANSLHLVTRGGSPRADSHLGAALELADTLHLAGVIRRASVHLDMAALPQLADRGTDGVELLYENTDSDAAAGNTPAECEVALARHPERGIVLDYAHALEMERAGGAGPQRFIAGMGAAIRQVHFSWPGNLYPESLVGPGFSTRHSMVHLLPEAAEEARSKLRGVRPEVVTIEGVVPPGEPGGTMVEREAALVRTLFNGRSA